MTNKTTAEEDNPFKQEEYLAKGINELCKNYNKLCLKKIAKEVEGLKRTKRDLEGIAHNKALEEVLKIITKHTE